MIENDIDYLRRRAAEELERAELSNDSAVSQIHGQMAILYANKVAELRHLTPLEIVEQVAMPQPSTPQPSTSDR